MLTPRRDCDYENAGVIGICSSRWGNTWAVPRLGVASQAVSLESGMKRKHGLPRTAKPWHPIQTPLSRPERYRAIYSAIGTRFGMYSLCEAVSD